MAGTLLIGYDVEGLIPEVRARWGHHYADPDGVTRAFVSMTSAPSEKTRNSPSSAGCWNTPGARTSVSSPAANTTSKCGEVDANQLSLMDTLHLRTNLSRRRISCRTGFQSWCALATIS